MATSLTEAGSFFGTGKSHLTFLYQVQLIKYGFLTVLRCRAAIHREGVALELVALSLVREGLMAKLISGRQELFSAAESVLSLSLSPMWEGIHITILSKWSSISLYIKVARECLALWSLIFGAALRESVFQMGQCLEDSGELGIECGCKV